MSRHEELIQIHKNLEGNIESLNKRIKELAEKVPGDYDSLSELQADLQSFESLRHRTLPQKLARMAELFEAGEELPRDRYLVDVEFDGFLDVVSYTYSREKIEDGN